MLALAHFCEQHGPSVVFCTQETPLPSKHAPSVPQVNKQPQQQSQQLKHQEQQQQHVLHAATAAVAVASNACPSCSSLGRHDPLLVSCDESLGIVFVSGQYPSDQNRYSIVRQACVRSLSCELCPGREGPVFFGDEASGAYCLGYMFKIKDSAARGFQRWYSLLIIVEDRIQLIMSWTFAISQLRTIVTDLQAGAEKVFEKEILNRKTNESLLGRMQNNSPFSPDQFLRRRGNQSLRSLPVLLNCKEIYINMHKYATWILRSLRVRFQEKQIHDNTLVQNHNIDELFSSLENLTPSAPTTSEVPYTDSENLETTQFDDSASIEITNNAAEVLSNLKISESLKDDNASTEYFSSLSALWMNLGPAHFRAMITHVVIGNQLVIRADSVPIAERIVEVLKNVIPEACCTTLSRQPQYEDPWRCNFLTLLPDARLPSDVDWNSTVLLDIRRRKPTDPGIDAAPQAVNGTKSIVITLNELHCSLTYKNPILGNRQIAEKLSSVSSFSSSSTSSSTSLSTSSLLSSREVNSDGESLSAYARLDAPLSYVARIEETLRFVHTLPDEALATHGGFSHNGNSSSMGTGSGNNSFRNNKNGSNNSNGDGNSSSNNSSNIGFRKNKNNSRSSDTLNRYYTSDDNQETIRQMDIIVDKTVMTLREEWMHKAKMFFAFARSGRAEVTERFQTFLSLIQVCEADVALLRFWTKGIAWEDRRALLIKKPSIGKSGHNCSSIHSNTNNNSGGGGNTGASAIANNKVTQSTSPSGPSASEHEQVINTSTVAANAEPESHDP